MDESGVYQNQNLMDQSQLCTLHRGAVSSRIINNQYESKVGKKEFWMKIKRIRGNKDSVSLIFNHLYLITYIYLAE